MSARGLDTRASIDQNIHFSARRLNLSNHSGGNDPVAQAKVRVPHPSGATLQTSLWRLSSSGQECPLAGRQRNSHRGHDVFGQAQSLSEPPAFIAIAPPQQNTTRAGLATVAESRGGNHWHRPDRYHRIP